MWLLVRAISTSSILSMMGPHDWTCPVCNQPNASDFLECINCLCPVSATDIEIKQRKNVYAKNAGASQERSFLSVNGLPDFEPALPFHIRDSSKACKAGELLLSIILRFSWLGVLIPLALAVFWYLVTSKTNAKGMFDNILIIIQIILSLVTIIPAIVFGLLPLSVIDERALFVRFFYKVSIPITILGLALWVIFGLLGY